MAGHRRPLEPISADADVLVDGALTIQDAGQIVKWIEATGKSLTTIYITHGHGDPSTLWTAAQAVFEQGQGASS